MKAQFSLVTAGVSLALGASMVTAQEPANGASALNSVRLYAGRTAAAPQPARTPATTAPAATPAVRPLAPNTPTYYRDILPIVEEKCFRCHNSQSVLGDWADYKTAFAHRRDIERRVYDSWKGEFYLQPMPAGFGHEFQEMTDQDRLLIKQWVDAGAPRGVRPIQTATNSKAEQIAAGKHLFSIMCTPCHQPTGLGLPGQFPPLAGSDFLNADKHRAIGILLHGLQGEVTVNGKTFNNSMPLLPLTDTDIANVLTFVYNSFGNSGKQVSVSEVTSTRANTAQVATRTTPASRPAAPEPPNPYE